MRVWQRCLRFINKHFESLYVDRIKKLPEAEGKTSSCSILATFLSQPRNCMSSSRSPDCIFATRPGSSSHHQPRKRLQKGQQYFPLGQNLVCALLSLNVVYQLRAKEHAQRATIEKLQAMLDSANDICRQMESIRRSEAHAVTRMREHEAASEQAKRDLEIAARERASAEAHNRTLQSQLMSTAKKLASMESKVTE